jgi:hypothetical protein
MMGLWVTSDKMAYDMAMPCPGWHGLSIEQIAERFHETPQEIIGRIERDLARRAEHEARS